MRRKLHRSSRAPAPYAREDPHALGQRRQRQRIHRRVAIIGLDALPLLLLAMLRYLPGMDPRGQAYMRMGSFYNGFVVLFTLFMVGMTWTSELTVFGILPENGSPIGTITTLVVGMGASFLLGNYMPKIKRNYTFGCKTPWALHDEWNWRLTHRFCGTAFVISASPPSQGA